MLASSRPARRGRRRAVPRLVASLLLPSPLLAQTPGPAHAAPPVPESATGHAATLQNGQLRVDARARASSVIFKEAVPLPALLVPTRALGAMCVAGLRPERCGSRKGTRAKLSVETNGVVILRFAIRAIGLGLGIARDLAQPNHRCLDDWISGASKSTLRSCGVSLCGGK